MRGTKRGLRTLLVPGLALALILAPAARIKVAGGDPLETALRLAVLVGVLAVAGVTSLVETIAKADDKGSMAERGPEAPRFGAVEAAREAANAIDRIR